MGNRKRIQVGILGSTGMVGQQQQVDGDKAECQGMVLDPFH